MCRAGLLFLGLLAASLLEVEPSQPAQRFVEFPYCPSQCICDTWLTLPRASCTGQRLYSIYTGVSSAVQALDLSNNTITLLEDRQLSRAGLTRLKYLNLSMNAINEIGMKAFEDLKNLTVLDLSLNHIDYIPPDTFYYNKNLRILHLAGNKFNLHVPQLHSTSIEELNLSGCRINYLKKDIFQGLKQLRRLDLSNNMLSELNKDVVCTLPFLQNLTLGRNVWSCNGATNSVKLYLRSRNIHTAKYGNIILKATSTESKSPKPSKNLLEPRTEKDPLDVDSWRELEEVIQDEEQQDNDSEAPGIFTGTFSNVSPFWFLLIGFLLGSGATMVVTYLWLSTTISCLIPRIRRAEAADSADASSQRVSLLRHLWQQENIANSEESSGGSGTGNAVGQTILPVVTTPSCPGTPPPPYREVMLHRNLYPRAAMAAAAQQPVTGRLLAEVPPTCNV